MQNNKELKNKKRSPGQRLARFALFFLLSIISLVLLLIILIQTGPVQNFARKKIVAYLNTKLNTRVDVARIDIDFPKLLVLEGVYIEDETKDTLVAGGALKVDLDMFKLLQNEIQINEIELERMTVKIKRNLPDTTFNFQFIANAFSSPQTEPTDTSKINLSIKYINLDKTRLVFQDVVTGNDVDLFINHFDTRISTIDVNTFRFDVPVVNINGVRGKVRQFAPLQVATVTPPPSNAPLDLAFTNATFSARDIDVAYKNEVNQLNTLVQLNTLTVDRTSFNMLASSININAITVNGATGNISMGKTNNITTTSGDTADTSVAQADMPWKITVNNLKMNNNQVVFNDQAQPVIKRGMDYGHLALNDLNLEMKDFYFANDTISGVVTKGGLTDKSGFVLSALQTKFTYTDRGVILKDLLVKTPGSEIKRTAVIQYPSLAAIQNNIGLLELDIDLQKSKIQVKDILLLAPFLADQPSFKNRNNTLYASGRIRGTVSRLLIDQFQFSGFGSTSVNVSGNINGLPNPNKVSGNLLVKNMTTSRSDILLLAPPGTLPSNITIPEKLSLTGSISGSMQKAFANVRLVTTLGSAALKGNITNATNKEKATYDARLALNKLNLGTLLQNPDTLGILTGNIAIKGTGYNPDKASAVVSGTINAIGLLKYTYTNLTFNGNLANQRFKAKASIADPNIDVSIDAEGQIGNDLPGLTLTASIDSIKTKPLNLTADNIIYRGNMVINFPEINPDALEGNAFITNSLLVYNDQRANLDSLTLSANYNAGVQTIDLKGPFFNANIAGTYKLLQLGDIFTQTINPYFSVDTLPVKTFTDPYNFTITAGIYNHPALRAFVPTLTRLDPVTLNLQLSTGDGLNGKFNAPFVRMGTNTIQNIAASFNGNDQQLQIATSVQKIVAGTSFSVYQTNLNTTVADNNINFGLAIKDKEDKTKYTLGGNISQTNPANYQLTLHPDSLLLNYNKWSVASNNMLQFGSEIVRATNFVISQNSQSLSLNSQGNSANSPLKVTFANFKIPTLTALVETDSLLADGSINGDIILNDVLGNPTFTTNITVDELAINKDTLGQLTAKIDNLTPNVFNTDVTLTGRGNDVSITGKYVLEAAAKNNLNFILDVKKLEMKSLEGPSFGSLSEATGYLSGKINIDGKLDAPRLNGDLRFNNTAFKLAIVNSLYQVNNEAISFNDNGIVFNTFVVKDSAGNSLTLDGRALTKNYLNYKFDLSLTSKEFRAVNSTKANNELYYGQLYFSSNLNIKGTEVAPIVDGSLSIDPKTNLSIVLPQDEPGLVAREGVVAFIDQDAPKEDSLFMVATLATYDSSFNQSQLTGFDVNINIEVNKEAIFNVIVDDVNGDFLKLQGEGIINGGVDPSGKITMTGTYTVESGGYELSFNLIKRRFNIQKGGKITWTGEPTTGNINMTAIYIANTAPIDLVGDQVSVSNRNAYLQKLPFEVRLGVSGEIMKPNLTFDITLPTSKNLRVSGDLISTVTTRLDQLRTEPSELNKQVFALLLLNRFVSEDPFSSSGGGFDAGIYARQSVSRLLNEQLNKLASDLVAGVEINFDLNTTEDYTTQQKQARTDLNVNLSKRLLNDRLKVSVGTNVELEGPQQSNQNASNIIGNVTIDYLLTKDGRFLLRGYRKNDYEAIVEGFVIETGLRFIITVDYDKLKEIFNRKKEQRQKNDTTKNVPDTVTTVIQVPAVASNTNNTNNNPTTQPLPEKTPADNRVKAISSNNK